MAQKMQRSRVNVFSAGKRSPVCFVKRVHVRVHFTLIPKGTLVLILEANVLGFVLHQSQTALANVLANDGPA